MRAEGVRERCPVQEECAAPYGIVTAGGKIFGERNWGRGPFPKGPLPPPLIPLNVSTGGEAARQGFRWVENALEEVTVPMKTENPFRAFCGAVGLGSVYVKEARSRTVFIVAFWESRVQGSQSAFQCMKEQLVPINCKK